MDGTCILSPRCRMKRLWAVNIGVMGGREERGEEGRVTPVRSPFQGEMKLCGRGLDLILKNNICSEI